MNPYMVYLADPFACVPANLLSPIALNLRGLFQKCVLASGGAFTDAFTPWLAGFPDNTKPHELLLYFLPDETKSIAAIDLGIPPTGGPRGFTVWKGTLGAVSEVYVSAIGPNADALSAVAFHELMHNKLRLQNAQLHPKGGLAAATVNAPSQISNANQTDMGSALAKAAPQYVQGFRSAFDGRHDPLSRYYIP